MQAPVPASNLGRLTRQAAPAPLATPEAVVARGNLPSTPSSRSPARGSSAAKTPASRSSSMPRAKLTKQDKHQMCTLAQQHLAPCLQSDSSYHGKLWLEFEQAKVKRMHQLACFDPGLQVAQSWELSDDLTQFSLLHEIFNSCTVPACSDARSKPDCHALAVPACEHVVRHVLKRLLACDQACPSHRFKLVAAPRRHGF